jgi:hypothetical protein
MPSPIFALKGRTTDPGMMNAMSHDSPGLVAVAAAQGLVTGRPGRMTVAGSFGR